MMISLNISAQFRWNVHAAGKHERALGRAKSMKSHGEQVQSKSRKVRHTAQRISQIEDTDSLKLTSVIDSAAVMPDSLDIPVPAGELSVDSGSVQSMISEEPQVIGLEVRIPVIKI